jgi:hypothetical protein
VPIVVELHSDQGAILERLPDIADVLHTTLPNYDDSSFRLLTKIDWYGDTEFEATQMALLLQELERITPTATGDQVTFMQKLQQIVRRCAETPGCKLKFLGD